MMEWYEVEQHASRLLRSGQLYGELYERMRLGLPQYMWIDRTPGEFEVMTGQPGVPVGWCSACEEWSTVEEIEEYSRAFVQDPYVAEEDYENWGPHEGWTDWEFQQGYQDGKVKHLAMTICPKCLSRVQCRDLLRGRKSMRRDRRFMVTWGKSDVDPQAIVMAGFDVIADWSRMPQCDPEQVMTATPVEVCLFRFGKPGQRWICEGVYDYGNHQYAMKWKRRRKCASGYVSGSYCGISRVQVMYERQALEDAAQGTRFEPVLRRIADTYPQPDAALYYDHITLMDRISKLGCIEYLYKLGYTDIGGAVIDDRDGDLINRRGKTAAEVLRLSPDEWGEVKGKKLAVSMVTLEIRKLVREKQLRLNMETICWLAHGAASDFHLRNFLATGHPDKVRAIKYCKRKKVALGDYTDLWHQLDEMEMDKTDPGNLYPGDFAKMHQRYAERLTLLAKERETHNNSERTQRIRAKIESGELGEYFFSALGLVMRPMQDVPEIISEGTKQNICVGSYAKRYAEGQDILCVIRREDALDTPLYTVEFTVGGKLTQCRGYSNSRPNPKDHLDLFWKLFEDMRGKLREQQKKGRRKTA